jgi:steroid 5-alpha reductase family enzyme
MVFVLDDRLLALTALVTIAYQLAFFFVTYACRFDKVTDFAGGTNFLVLALLTLLVGGHYGPRQIVLTALVVLWALRLAGFLLYRILLWGEDRRFDDTRDNLAKLAIFWAFQAVWVWTVSLPLTILNASSGSPQLGPSDFIGWTILLVGLVLESVADMQKLWFKQDPQSRGRWIDVGVWRWSRHPNYFGEMLVWLGSFIAAARVFVGGEWAAVMSPIFIVLLLLFVSGLPIVEESADRKHGSNPDYRAYKQRTSILLPLPPPIYEKIPTAIKSSVLLDWPMYNTMNKQHKKAPDESSSINDTS